LIQQIITLIDVTAPTVAVDNWYGNDIDNTQATSTDNAANPSRTAPGDLIFDYGPTPVITGYKPKTG
jgi:hypothetical protein